MAYINDNYMLDFKNIISEVYIGKGIIGVIEKRLENEKVHQINSLKILTPYLKIETIDKFKTLNEKSSIKIITNKGNEKNQNIDKLKKITKDITLYEFKYNPETNDFKDKYNYLNLHAKIYLINEKYLFISSANLTSNGTTNNFETIVFIKTHNYIDLEKKKDNKDYIYKYNNNKLIQNISENFDSIAIDKNIIKEKETLLSIIIDFFKKHNFSD